MSRNPGFCLDLCLSFFVHDGACRLGGHQCAASIPSVTARLWIHRQSAAVFAVDFPFWQLLTIATNGMDDSPNLDPVFRPFRWFLFKKPRMNGRSPRDFGAFLTGIDR